MYSIYNEVILVATSDLRWRLCLGSYSISATVGIKVFSTC